MTPRSRKPAPRPAPKPKRIRARRVDSHSAELIAAALSEADRQADAVVAKKYGVAVGTIHTWRTRVATDPELEKLLALERRKLASTWRDSAALVLMAIGDKVRSKLADGVELDFGLIAAAKTFGAICVESSALLGEDPDAEPATPPSPSPAPPPAATNSDTPGFAPATEVH